MKKKLTEPTKVFSANDVIEYIENDRFGDATLATILDAMRHRIESRRDHRREQAQKDLIPMHQAEVTAFRMAVTSLLRAADAIESLRRVFR